ncbi:MAG: hypothetical protein L3J52_07155 [Proteobacteria bacterium]|nr:hypothetical protein [Pseudomonadota bacterium]
MNEINNQDKSSQANKPLYKLAQLSARITLKFGVVWREYVELYKQNVVREAKSQKPRYSVVELSARTGVDRRYIKHYLHTEEIAMKPSKIQLVLDQVKHTCNRTNSNTLPKHGPFQTFESICLSLAYGTLTPNSIATELVRQGNIIDRGDHYELTDFSFMPSEDDMNQYLQLLTNEMERFTDTVIYNSEVTDKNMKRFQRNIFSTQIPPEKHQTAKDKVTKILQQSYDEIDAVLSEVEENVAMGTYPSFGASMYVFGDNANQGNSK